MYPIMLKLKDKPIAVIGGGKIAARKIKFLLEEEAKITVVSPSLHPSINTEKVKWLKKRYEKKDIREALIIFTCTNHDEVNEQIKQDADPKQWVNVTSNKELADFYNMSVFKYQQMTIAISSEGVSPLKVKKTKEKLLEWFEKEEGCD